jgi:hypothetical protein
MWNDMPKPMFHMEESHPELDNFSRDASSNSSRNRNLKSLALVCSDHQHKPGYQSNQAKYPRDQSMKGPETKVSTTHEGKNQHHSDHEQSPENHDRLRRMEAHERPLVNKQKDDPSEPSQEVAQKTGHILLQAAGRRASGIWRIRRRRCIGIWRCTGIWGRIGIRRWNSRSSDCRSTLRTERNTVIYVGTALAAKSHFLPAFRPDQGIKAQICLPFSSAAAVEFGLQGNANARFKFRQQKRICLS